MPSSATPSPLDQLAGIEQLQREEAALLDPHARHDSLWIREKEAARRRDALNAAAATLATLREVLTEWREAHAPAGMFIPSQAMIERREAAEIALYRWLTPDSPRQAGEE